MAAPTNTLISNNAVGNRESLHNIISILNKDETPFQAAIGSGSAEATYEEWQLDSLGSPDTNNAQLEGDDTTAAAIFSAASALAAPIANCTSEPVASSVTRRGLSGSLTT